MEFPQEVVRHWIDEESQRRSLGDSKSERVVAIGLHRESECGFEDPKMQIWREMMRLLKQRTVGTNRMLMNGI